MYYVILVLINKKGVGSMIIIYVIILSKKDKNNKYTSQSIKWSSDGILEPVLLDQRDNF